MISRPLINSSDAAYGVILSPVTDSAIFTAKNKSILFKMRITAPKPVNFGYGFYLSVNQYGMDSNQSMVSGY